MIKKFHKENSIPTRGEYRSNTDNVKKLSENKLSRLVGPSNAKRWRDLKLSFSAKSNIEFMTKLLDIAEEYLKRNVVDGDVSKVQSKKQKNNHKNNPKNKVDINNVCLQKPDVSTEKFQEIPEKSTPNSQKSNTDSITPLKKLKRATEASSNIQNVKAAVSDIKQEFPVDPNDNSTFHIQTETSVKIEENGTPKNLDKIKIKLCHHCNTHHIEDQCPIYLPHYIINDSLDQSQWGKKFKILHEIQTNKLKSEGEEAPVYCFSILSLPELLYIEETIASHGSGIFAKEDIEPFTQFGPMIGSIVKEKDIPEDVDLKYIWEIPNDSGNIYVDTESTVTSNWCKYLRPAPSREEKNLSVISKNGKLYFVCTKFVKSGEELLFWQDCPKLTKKKLEKTTCGGCNIDFSHPHYYRIHCSLFHDVRYSLTIRKYHCKVCGAAVLGKENIIKHASELHNGQGAYQCQFCKKFFLRLNYLEMHRTYGCSANPQRTCPLCDFCGKKFCQPQKLKVHIKRMHSDISEVLKEFQCKSCMKILGSRAALQRHAKEVHEKQADGQCFCSRCGKKFQNKSNLKIHMLTHSGIKPFKCHISNCNSAFTTKQCLQFHYKKIHNFTEENMPKIERNIDYTFQAYSGNEESEQNNKIESDKVPNTISRNKGEKDSDFDNTSLDSENVDDPKPQDDSSNHAHEPRPPSPNHPTSTDNYPKPITTVKVQSKGSKKWIADEPTSKLSEIYSVERLSKVDLSSITLQDPEIYGRSKLSTINEFGKHEASNASLLVEAALDSVCNEPNIDIDVSPAPHCADSLVNNLYGLAAPDNLPYHDQGIGDSRDINLLSPSVNDHVSVTDELNEDIGIPYPNFPQQDFSPSQSPDIHRSNFVRNYINSLSPQNLSPVPSPPRYAFGHADQSDDSNGMTVQNLSLNNSKDDIQLDLSLYKTYKSNGQDYMRKVRLGEEDLDQDHIDVINSDLPNMENEDKELSDREDHPRYTEELASEIRSKFDLDLDVRLKGYEGIDCEALRQRSHAYEGGEVDFRNKQYGDLMESDFRADRNFEPLILNTSELQGLDMSARSFHNYSNINRYHPLYPEVDRVDLRLNYSPPPPAYTHADILRVVSLDLTPPGRHSVDLSLRNHPLHQMANTRLLSDHGLQSNPHRLLDQGRFLNAELTPSRLIAETSSRILTDHSTSRILNTELGSTHLLSSEPSRLLGDDGRLMGDTRILGATPSGPVSPGQGFSGYSVAQNPYHPTALPSRPHVASPTPAPYPYAAYY
ncbi:unnamed protein product [Phaedon cochleariae]|uniref:Uncharacterized protein n=1 Tax=Phaedon cochleariae TaxID=80249 RepID=A0A9N9SLI1_PHACE|nr:unnamed protein product [Phaedon cochleariae]